tara:strand:+ start:1218 stop:1934 length:717 start_codon:yes stop_codon:yes gene_type:complete
MDNKKWSELINLDKYYKEINIDTYDSDSDIDNDNINVNMYDDNLDIYSIINHNNYTKQKSIDIIKNQDIVVNYLCKKIQNNIINKKLLIEIINYLKKTSLHLQNKINQKMFKHNYSLIKKDKIIRSSYKFCNYKHNCTYNYDKNKKKGCYADHYPHDMIYADCDALLFCLDNFYKSENDFYNKEIVKCINTISFVIRHMYEELNNLCLYSCTNEYDNFHCVKNCVKKYIHNKTFKSSI